MSGGGGGDVVRAVKTAIRCTATVADSVESSRRIVLVMSLVGGVRDGCNIRNH